MTGRVTAFAAYTGVTRAAAAAAALADLAPPTVLAAYVMNSGYRSWWSVDRICKGAWQ